jgi:hypothetical protein
MGNNLQSRHKTQSASRLNKPHKYVSDKLSNEILQNGVLLGKLQRKNHRYLIQLFSENTSSVLQLLWQIEVQLELRNDYISSIVKKKVLQWRECPEMLEI